MLINKYKENGLINLYQQCSKVLRFSPNIYIENEYKKEIKGREGMNWVAGMDGWGWFSQSHQLKFRQHQCRPRKNPKALGSIEINSNKNGNKIQEIELKINVHDICVAFIEEEKVILRVFKFKLTFNQK